MTENTSRAIPGGFIDEHGVRHFRNVPEDWLADLGRIAVLASRLEKVARDLAKLLNIPHKPRFSADCKAIAARLADPGPPQPLTEELPPDWSAEVAQWVGRAPGVMDTARNVTFHSSYFHRFTSDGWRPARRSGRSTEPLDIELVEHTHIRAALDALDELEGAGMRLWLLGIQAQDRAP